MKGANVDLVAVEVGVVVGVAVDVVRVLITLVLVHVIKKVASYVAVERYSCYGSQARDEVRINSANLSLVSTE